jgi:hypothetical protein
MVLHVLAVLFTFWSVAFNAFVNYQPVATLADAEYVQVGWRVLLLCQHSAAGAWLGCSWCCCSLLVVWSATVVWLVVWSAAVAVCW